MDASLHPFEVENAFSFDTPYEYKLKTRHFCNKTVDFVMTKIKHRIPKEHKGIFKGTMTFYPPTLTDEERQAKDEENIVRAARRAKQSVHFAVRSLGGDHMLTLNTRENIQDRVRFFDIFTRFVRLVRTKDVIKNDLGLTGVYIENGKQQIELKTRKHPRVWGYVAVPELQERGAYHMHVACVGKQDLELLRACWKVALGGTPNDRGSASLGEIDVQYREQRFSGRTELHKTFSLVKYMTKYITKSFDDVTDLDGSRRFNSSRSIPKPVVSEQFIWSSYQNNGGDFVTAMKEVYAIASFVGVTEMEPWNRGEDIFILRGVVD